MIDNVIILQLPRAHVICPPSVTHRESSIGHSWNLLSTRKIRKKNK